MHAILKDVLQIISHALLCTTAYEILSFKYFSKIYLWSNFDLRI